MNNKMIRARTYDVYLSRPSTGSSMKVQVTAFTDAEAKIKAMNDMAPTWKAIDARIP